MCRAQLLEYSSIQFLSINEKAFRDPVPEVGDGPTESTCASFHLSEIPVPTKKTADPPPGSAPDVPWCVVHRAPSQASPSV